MGLLKMINNNEKEITCSSPNSDYDGIQGKQSRKIKVILKHKDKVKEFLFNPWEV